MVKVTSFQKAQRETALNSKMLQRHINKVWNGAANAPMFRKEYQAMDKKKLPDGKIKVTPKMKDGKPVMQRRSVRLIGGHAYNIAVAGAVINAQREIAADHKAWGLEASEEQKHPFMLGMPKGSKLMLEQFLSAYVASAVLKSTRMMKALHPDGKPEETKHKRLNKDYIKRGFLEVNNAIDGNGGTVRASVVVPLKVKKAGEYKPPATEEAEGTTAA